MHTKISKEPTILRRPQVQEGTFPASVSLGPRAVGWLESDVSDWISVRVKIARQCQQPAAR